MIHLMLPVFKARLLEGKKGLKPDFKTIANFRADNRAAFKVGGLVPPLVRESGAPRGAREGGHGQGPGRSPQPKPMCAPRSIIIAVSTCFPVVRTSSAPHTIAWSGAMQRARGP
jgi:hypothetical protein